MSWSSKGKVAEMGTVTPVVLWGRKKYLARNTVLTSGSQEALWKVGGLRATSDSPPFSTWTSLCLPNGLYEFVTTPRCHTCHLASFRPS